MLNFQHGVVWGHKSARSFALDFFQIVVAGILVLTPSYAAPPVPFGSWANQGGTIQANCPAGFTCTENVSSENMMQRMLTDNATGQTYVQVIIDDNTQGTHQSETFVNASNPNNLPIPMVDPADPTVTPGIVPPEVIPDNVDLNTQNTMNSANNGVSTQMTISQAGVASTTFDYSYTINSGWAVNPGQLSTDINFRVTDTMAVGASLDYAFDLQQRSNAAGQVTGRKFGIDQMVQNSGAVNGSNAGGRDDLRFVLRRARGDFVTAGSATLPPSAGGMGMMGGGTTPNPANGGGAPPFGITPNPQAGPFPNPPGAPTGNPMGMGGGGVPPGGSVAWAAGAEITVIWIGQVCPGCMIGGMGGMMGGTGAFSFQQYENLSTGASAASRSIMGSAPFTWTDPPFGAQPGGL